MINNKSYIGITKQNPPQLRWGVNGINYRSNPYFYNAILKYGWSNFEHRIIYEDLSKEEACEKEKELIKHLNTQNKEYGYNILEGGNTPKIPKEVREKMSKAMMGNKNGLGHPCSEEKKQKIATKQYGRIFSENHRKKMSEAAKNRHTPCSDEKRKRLSQVYPHKKQVYCIETDTVYESVHDCARQLSVDPTTVSAVCRGKHKHTKGYHLFYYNDVIKAKRLSS